MLKNKKLVVFISLSLVLLAIFSVLFYRHQAKPKFEHEGWINCMPSPGTVRSELCKRAEEANYPYIAY